VSDAERGGEWFSDRDIGRWLLFAFVGLPVAYAAGVGIAKLIGTGNVVAPLMTSSAALVLGVAFVLRPSKRDGTARKARKSPTDGADVNVPTEHAPTVFVRARGLRAAGICAGVSLGVSRVHGWIGGLGVLCFWAGTPIAGYVAGRLAARQLPEEEEARARAVLTGLFGVRAVRLSWVGKWVAAFIGLLVAVGVVAAIVGSK
jgi:hypothetical protein